MLQSASNKPFGQCFFFDVGQGSANAIVFKDRRAILIDTGKRGAWRIVETQLKNLDVRSIECVVLSHNDDDHVAGWEQCVMTFGNKMKSIYLVHDRRIQPGKTLDVTWSLAAQKVIPEPKRAESGVIWQEDGCSLEVLSPKMRTASNAYERGLVNDCSAVVLFRYEKGSVLFSGDAGDAIWGDLLSTRLAVPIRVDIATMPHHGSSTAAKSFSQTVHADLTVVSVSTNNPHGHPTPQAIDASVTSGSKVVCTQITSQCHNLPKLKGRNVVEAHQQSACYKNPRYSGCVGTVVSVLTRDGIRHPWMASHQEAIRRLDSPLCCKLNDPG